MKRLLSLLILALPASMNAQMSNDDVHKYDHTNQLFYRNARQGKSKENQKEKIKKREGACRFGRYPIVKLKEKAE